MCCLSLLLMIKEERKNRDRTLLFGTFCYSSFKLLDFLLLIPLIFASKVFVIIVEQRINQNLPLYVRNIIVPSLFQRREGEKVIERKISSQIYNDQYFAFSLLVYQPPNHPVRYVMINILYLIEQATTNKTSSQLCNDQFFVFS